MEIQEIKQNLTIATVLHYYGLKTDKTNRICCPFHEDKTPSLQIYYKTQTAYCFSSNCRTYGKSMDVIDFIMLKENSTKHEAIKKAVEILGNQEPNKKDRYQKDLSREQFLGNMFQYFRNAINNSKPAKDYLQKRSLDFTKLEVGYNSGQFHHGTRKDENLINQCLEYGLLLDKGIIGRTGEKAYGVFGKWSICFALRNRENEVAGLYFRSTLNDENAKHFYLKDRKGIYPNYPDKNTKKLILMEAIIDCASLLQIPKIKENYSLISCFGTNGLNEEILNSIKSLEKLEEIIFCFDNDDAGKEAVLKYGKVLQEELPNIKISSVELPNNDVNETLQLHDEEIFLELLEKRNFLFSNEKEKITVTEEKSAQSAQPAREEKSEPKGITEFLGQKNLLKTLNYLIEKSGIIGEENSRLLLFLITISYLNKNPLHALVQGSSGSGKTHIINRIADLMPQEDVLRFTRITESSLYNWGEFDLFQKIIIIEDLDGLKEDALYALREFISNQVLRSSVTIKDKKGNNKSSHKIVKGQFSSLSATTKGETYEDNMSRSFLIAVDESKEQTQRIIQYQNKRNAGEINPDEQQKAIHFIQKLVRNLKYYEVINPYATKLNLPEKVHKIRRLNEMYQAVIKQVTFLNQYQRKLTKDNQLITEIEDIEQATEILFESIVLKVDELDGSLRQFFERLKKFVKNDREEFLQREIRQEFNLSKTQLQRYINSLLELEYIKQIGGYANKGIKYKIGFWDNHQKLRAEIKDFLQNQINELKITQSAPSKPRNKTLVELVNEKV
ncbi:CHC2 zinc finger domain-containing protein [Bergeyella sp. RCAD1439]|uniref:CHC2 zinc finger domain-containing protein n=1 Tax=Bergeyella anatis TaxID=3113737 RepID=UPI002E17C4D9|nr:CHC2 zinc finger domain-containing protein [Bergeyella sp. RCAD1439]